MKPLAAVRFKTDWLGDGSADTEVPWSRNVRAVLWERRGNAFAVPVDGHVRVVVEGCRRWRVVNVDLYTME